MEGELGKPRGCSRRDDPARASLAATISRQSASAPPRASDLTAQRRQHQLGWPRAPSVQRFSPTATSPPGPTPPNPVVVWIAEPELRQRLAQHRWGPGGSPSLSSFQGRCPVRKVPSSSLTPHLTDRDRRLSRPATRAEPTSESPCPQERAGRVSSRRTTLRGPATGQPGQETMVTGQRYPGPAGPGRRAGTLRQPDPPRPVRAAPGPSASNRRVRGGRRTPRHGEVRDPRPSR
jgi:hypothetical protein